MGPTTYALCQKAILGPAMWITGLCAFPPLISGLDFSLVTAGGKSEKSFSVPVDKSYEFILKFEFASTEARLEDKIVGSAFTDECRSNPKSLEARPGYGKLIPILVTVRRATTKEVLLRSRFDTLCLQSHVDNRKTRSIGWIALPRGDYVAELTNIDSHAELSSVKTTILLVPGGGK